MNNSKYPISKLHFAKIKKFETKMNKILLIILKLVLLYFTTSNCVCPIEKDPLNLARCIQLDIASILYAVKNSNDLSPVCLLADRYMECLKTYSRGCVGFNVN